MTGLGSFMDPESRIREDRYAEYETEMLKTARKVAEGCTAGRSAPLTRAFVGAVIGSKQMNCLSGGA
jgi:hypothetical protein